MLTFLKWACLGLMLCVMTVFLYFLLSENDVVLTQQAQAKPPDVFKLNIQQFKLAQAYPFYYQLKSTYLRDVAMHMGFMRISLLKSLYLENVSFQTHVNTLGLVHISSRQGKMDMSMMSLQLRGSIQLTTDEAKGSAERVEINLQAGEITLKNLNMIFNSKKEFRLLKETWKIKKRGDR